VFQSVEFSTLWYSVYTKEYEPVLVVGGGSDRRVAGLLLLAQHRSRGSLVCVGAHHAEYHTWLARPGFSEDFIRRAIVLISSRLRLTGTLTFLFLAPNTPTGWCTTGKSPKVSVSLRLHKRPLLDLELLGAGNDPLRKKSNKSKLARLARIGPVRLASLETAEELDGVIDRVIALCDFRQCAIYGTPPFEADELKRPFYLGLMARSAVGHATALYAGETLVAAHIGIVNGESVTLGLLAHSPMHSRHSPGKLLLLMLSKRLAEQGFRLFDLTPGGDYKEDFANEHDDVYVLEVFFSRVAAVKFAARQTLLRALKSLVSQLPNAAISWQRVRTIGTRLTRPGRWRVGYLVRAPITVLNLLRRWSWRTSEFCIYGIGSQEVAKEVIGSDTLRRNSLADLLCYVPSSRRDVPRREFLQAAMRRLEEGQIVYTLAEKGILLHYSWLQPQTKTMGSDYNHRLVLPEGSAVLWDDFTHPSARGRGYHQESIRARLADCARMNPPRYLYVGIRADNIASRHSYEKLGFKHCSSAWLRVRFLHSTRWVDGSC
jgi:CelD/BcsL family acetyltransferase involved in cellulose biosynthesis/RimJ/RimL family protein N-acetyltransferase